MKTELYALKLFVMELIYNINKGLGREQCKNDARAKLQTENEIIEILLENFSDTANLSYTLYKPMNN